MTTTNQYLPLSKNQFGLWHLQTVHPDLYAYNTSSVFRVRSSLDIHRLQQALHQLVCQHALLRTTFVLQNDKPHRVVHESLRPAFDHVMVSAVDEAELRSRVQAVHERPFDLNRGPLVRLTIFTRADNDHVLLLTFHHILLDFGSQIKLTQRLFDLYATDDTPTSKLEVQNNYDDFVFWQQEHLAGQVACKERAYWSQQLQAPLPILDLPMDGPLPRQQTFNGATYRFTLPATLSQELITLARSQRVTPFTLLLTAYAVLMARYSNQDDIIIGIPADERIRAPQRFQQTLGHMVNPLPTRIDLSDQPTLIDLIQQTQQTVMGGLFHQHYPFTHMVQDAKWAHNPSRNPLFDVMFNMPVLGKATGAIPFMEGTAAEPVTYRGLHLEQFDLNQQAAHAFFELDMWSTETGMVGFLKYNADLFTEERAETIAAQYQHLLTQISLNATLPLDKYSLVTPAMHTWFPDLSAPIPEPHYDLVPSIIMRWAKCAPNQIAISQGEISWNYHEIMFSAIEIAHWLQEKNLPKGAVVAIWGPNCPHLIASLLGALLNGNVFVLLDPNLPQQRWQVMLETGQAKACLFIGKDEETRSWLTQRTQSVLHICPSASPRSLLGHNSGTNYVEPVLLPDDPAYLFFTSGTTGTPKGVLGTHKGLAHFLHWQRQTFSVTPADRVAQLTSLSFDVVLRAIFLPLVSGATLVLPDRADILLGEEILPWMDEERITIVHTVPSLVQSWLTGVTERGAERNTNDEIQGRAPIATLKTLRWLFSAGEPLTSQLVTQWRQLLPHTSEIVNLYGPTETTLAKCYYHVPADVSNGIQPIGKPQPATHVVIMNQGRLCGVGELGEIVIRTPFRTQGYINQDNPFIQNPFSDEPNDLVYHTGDYGRMRLDGLIDILGRLDTQVKIRGIRIEVEEIETAFLQHPCVQQAAVTPHGEGTDKKLVAYLVIKNPDALPEDISQTRHQQTHQIPLDKHEPTHLITAIHASLQQALPSYMIPAAFVVLDALPLTSNGKIDRRALPTSDYVNMQAEFVAPRNEIEQQLATIWREVLHIDRIGIYDDFFTLGGHSLMATQVISRVRGQLNLDIPLNALFEASQLGDFAQMIHRAANQSDVDTTAIAEAIIQPRPEGTHREDPLPLSFAQQRLWVLEQLQPDSALFNLSKIIRLEGQLDVVALEESFRYLIARHESLRTTFDSQHGEPVQVIHTPPPFVLPVIPIANEAEAQRFEGEEATMPFDVREGPLLRAKLLRLTETEHLLLLTMHHIISDGWSMGVLIHELTHAYTAYMQGLAPTLPNLPIQYADFAVWQRNYLTANILEEQLAFWRGHLAGAPPLLELPTDRVRPPVQSYRGVRYAIQLDSDLTEKLNQLAQSHNGTLFMVLLAAFKVLLSRYSGQTDIVLGTLIANRNRAELENLIGFFANTVALRTSLDDNPSFTQLLERVRQTTLAMYENQDLPIEHLVNELQPERTLSYSPIIQAMLILQNASSHRFDLPNLTATVQHPAFPFAWLDLTLTLVESAEGLRGYFEYSTDLFDEATISRLSNHFNVLLEGIVSEPDQPVLELPMLTSAELHQIVYEWNDNILEVNTLDDGEPQTIHALFEHQVARTPDAVAVVFLNTQLTYRELNERANQLAHHLISLGVVPDVLVGICVERSLNMIVALMGVLKAGGAYVPMDPNYPKDRLGFMLEDSEAPILLTQEKFVEELPDHRAQVICLDRDWPTIAQEAIHNPQSAVTPEHRVYCIFTSGSTGRPKGAQITHRNFVNNLHAYFQAYQVDETVTSTLQMASFSFDMFGADLQRTLWHGGKLVICPQEWLLDPEQLYRLMRMEAVDFAQFVPAVLRSLIQYLEKTGQDLRFMRILNIGGDVWYMHEYEQFRRFCSSTTRIINSYGITECTIDSSYFEHTDQQVPLEGIVPIGRPFANTQLYILDEQRQPVPIGVAGELYIGGANVGLGYLNRPELTQERFVPNPWSKNGDNATLYKTGDLARYLPDGNIDFLGRSDHQVKIRGFRVELGEIETLIGQHPDVREAVVMAQDQGSGKRLVAYIVPSTSALQISMLRSWLEEQLPDHMVPTSFVFLDALPLTPNGKVNRRDLPIPNAEHLARSAPYTPPASAEETQLAEIWQRVLQVDKIGIHDNFFEVGGDSILGIQIISRARQVGIHFSVRQLFQNRTIAQLTDVAMLSEVNAANGIPQVTRVRPSTTPIRYPLSPMQLEMIEHLRSEPDSMAYWLQFSCRLQGALDVDRFKAAWQQVIVRHPALRTTFEGPGTDSSQVVSQTMTLPWHEADWQNAPPREQEEQLAQFLQEDLQSRLSLDQGPLLRCALMQCTPNSHYFVISHHHLLTDGWSFRILLMEVMTYYRAAIQGGHIQLPAPRPYSDYIDWLAQQDMHQAERFWQDTLRDVHAPTPVIPGEQWATPISYAEQKRDLSADLTTELQRLARQNNLTLNTLVQGAVALLLSQMSGQHDVVFGVTFSGRSPDLPEVESIMGLLIHSLPLRVQIPEEQPLLTWLQTVLQTQVELEPYIFTPLEMIQQWCNHPEPLFQCNLRFQNFPMGEQLRQSWSEELSISNTKMMDWWQYPLNIVVTPSEKLNLTITYNERYFNQYEVSCFLHALEKLFSRFVDKPQALLSDLLQRDLLQMPV